MFYILSKKILLDFLIKNNINEIEINLIQNQINEIYSIFEDRKIKKYDDNIIYYILIDFYNLNTELVKKIAKDYEKKTKLFLGREEKDQIKYILDYKDYKTQFDIYNFDILLNIIKENYYDKSIEAIELFLNNYQKSDDKRKTRILFSIFLKLFHKIEFSNIKLIDIFNINENFIEEELGSLEKDNLKNICLINNNADNITSISKILIKFI